MHDMGAALRGRLSHADPTDYNAVQKLAYVGVMLLIIAVVPSGLAIWKPVQFQIITETLGGYELSRRIHFICMSPIVAFVACTWRWWRWCPGPSFHHHRQGQNREADEIHFRQTRQRARRPASDRRSETPAGAVAAAVPRVLDQPGLAGHAHRLRRHTEDASSTCCATSRASTTACNGPCSIPTSWPRPIRTA